MAKKESADLLADSLVLAVLFGLLNRLDFFGFIAIFYVCKRLIARFF
jgi:hypothetical protein